MRQLCLLLTLLLVASGCSTIRSTIGIDPGETFVLGGKQEGAFRAQLMNVGEVAVEIAQRTASGDTLVLATLAPGQSVDQPFPAGSAALLINRSGRAASIQGVISGDTNLGMRYTPAE